MEILPVFEQDHNEMQNYYYFENSFEREEISRIIQKAESQSDFIRGNTFGDNSIRRSNIAWLQPTDDWMWIYDKLSDMVSIANRNIYRYDLRSITDAIQYTVYDSSEKGHYGAHIDIGPGRASLRKISIVVQLSDPNSYEGGDLQILRGGEQWEDLPRGLGLTVCFSSFLMHRVTPVTKGIRRSLVLWVGGDHFR